ncbi:PREDICTED: probable serine/threonine-protein kinase DDB_G0280111 [Priapulus caudatus]|uniref:ditrans,polycis-polyprenyl diphosphate synthase [(2E,6E)-farnesyldiphosphate specific] n=1 Tax=Priapulus caudatus TaxID=37621 RepID=A0ABM1F0E0_PRICU|nr:PREDICTED: probable serine/threonine-protein kinase DDB_G0280111 [Priapulus caudatus]
MSWFRDDDEQVTWLQRLCARVLRAGPIPRHIAFIMDGNRRFAVRNKMERLEGHVSGFEKLAEVFSPCRHGNHKHLEEAKKTHEQLKRRLQDECDLEHLRQEVASIRSRFPDPESESGHPLTGSGTEAGAGDTDVEIEKRAGDDDSNMDAARHASDSNMADATPAGELGSYRRARDERIDRFLHWLEDDRLQQLQRLQQQHQQQQQQHHQQQQQQQVPLEPQQEGLCARS